MASEYGWGKKEILEQIYFDEYIDYCFRIKQRHNNNYKILLAIAMNPNSEKPKDLWEVFEDEYQPSYSENAKLDKSGFERLKLAMVENPRLIVK